jgi:hypothetical protein
MRARNIHVPAAATPDELLEEIGNKLEEHRQFLEDFLRRGT